MRNLIMIPLLVVFCGEPMWAVETQAILDKPQIEPGKIHVQPTALPKPKGLILTPETYPKTSGSTSAEPMGVWIACRLLGKKCFWPPNRWGDRRMMPLKANGDPIRPVSEAYDSMLYRNILHSGTHGSYKKLISGKTDLIYECRRPSEDERTLMKTNKVELDIRAIALDAFVFLRHKDNPVTGLSLAQVKDIYTPAKDGKGKIRDWRLVGGPETEIHAYVRNRNSGSQETMMSLVMKESPILSGRSMTGVSMAGPYNMIHRDKAGIGFTFFYYQRYMSPLPRRPYSKGKRQTSGSGAMPPVVKMFAIDGVSPSRATIANGEYPLVTKVYAVIRKDLKTDHPAVKLRDWLLTPEGQSIVSETGYVPITADKKRQAMNKTNGNNKGN